MKGQIALLLSFKKYFKKYSFLLFLLIVMVCFSSVVLTIVDNMYVSYDYREKAMVKGDALLYAPFSSANAIVEALENASEKMDGCVTDIRVKHPPLSIYLEGDGNKRVYLDLVISPALSGNEIIILEEYVPKGDVKIYDGEKSRELDCTLSIDDERALSLWINSHEALCSEELYKKIAPYQGVSWNEYSGEIEFNVKEGTDLEALLNVLVEESGLKSEVIKTGYKGYIYIADSKISSRRCLSDWYVYDSRSGDYWKDVIPLFNDKYNDIELINEVDRFNTPVWFLAAFAKASIPLLCMAFIFIAVSIYEVRRKEFKLYKDLGMSRMRITLLLLAESVVMILFVALVSALIIFICSVVLRFYAPLGAQIVKGKAVYFRDLYTLTGKYSMEGGWKRFFSNMAYTSFFFVVILFFFNFIMLCIDEKKEKRA